MILEKRQRQYLTVTTYNPGGNLKYTLLILRNLLFDK